MPRWGIGKGLKMKNEKLKIESYETYKFYKIYKFYNLKDTWLIEKK